MNPLTIAKFVGIGLLVALVLGGAFMLRHELIEKGKNLVYAQDNAALLKAQKEQAARDALLIASQNSYINDLQNSGSTVKEKIRVVQAPCTNDGRGDPRLDDTADWVRGRLAADPLQAPGEPQPKAAMPTPLAPAASRPGPVR